MPKTNKSASSVDSSLEKRLCVVESQLSELTTLIQDQLTPRRDWRKAIGIFTGDDGMKEFFEDAMKLREADRAKARKATRRRAKL